VPPGWSTPKVANLLDREGNKAMIGTVLIVLLIMALLGVFPRWSHSRSWGYAPSGGLGVILLIVVVLVLLGRL
jgi:Protein of unknown function (DUF3309)